MTEKAGKAEAVTEFDKEFEQLCEQMDQIKLLTEKMLVQLETLMQPNPSESASPTPHPSPPLTTGDIMCRCTSGGLGQDEAGSPQAITLQLLQFAGERADQGVGGLWTGYAVW